MTQKAAGAKSESSTLRAPESRRLYEQLEQLLRVHIEEQGMSPGDRLPSERELSRILKVSRASLRQATVALEVQGILEVRHGGGIYVRSLTVDPSRLKALLTRRRRLPDVLEAREGLECMLARLAAQRRTEADLEAINRAIEAMAEDIAAGGIGATADHRFHTAVAKAAKNKLIFDVMKALEDPIHETRLESLSEQGRPPRSLADHRRIAEAIRLEDPRGAEAAMRRHLKVVADTRLLRWMPKELDQPPTDNGRR